MLSVARLSPSIRSSPEYAPAGRSEMVLTVICCSRELPLRPVLVASVLGNHSGHPERLSSDETL